MKIGIDIDDTLCKTKELVELKLHDYCDDNNLNIDNISSNEIEMEKFYNEYLEEIYKDAEVKKNAVDVLRRLKNKGNEIFVITARGAKFKTDIDFYKVTVDWLEKNNIVVDGIMTSCYGENKVSVCKREKIDIMVESDPYNYKLLTNNNILCLLFDDHDLVSFGEYDFSSWTEIEKFIEMNRKGN